MSRPPLRVALLAPLISPIREPPLGGVSTMLTDLAGGLAAAGQDVDLFAATGSAVPGLRIIGTGVDPEALASTLFRPLAGASGGHATEASWEAFRHAYSLIEAGTYDVVHNHAFDQPAIELAATMISAPVVHTLHLAPDPTIAGALSRVARAPRPPVTVSVSRTHAAAWAGVARIDAVIRPGIPVAAIPWSASGGDRLLVAGRLSPEKGQLEAIEIARRAGRELVIAGHRYDDGYVTQVEAEAARGGVVLAGSLERAALWEVMAASAALLFPIDWEEPFGLVCAEAQAAGCPVIGFRRGAFPDLIVDGVTGAVVEPGDIEACARAVLALERYDRTLCRRHAEQDLDLAPMITAHVQLYENLLVRS